MSLTPPEGPEWVLQEDSVKGCAVAERVRVTARETWPFVRSHALKELANKPWIQDHLTFASEIWEEVLCATAVRIKEDCLEVEDLRAYLIGAFNRRFIGALMKAQERRNVLEFLPLPDGIDEHGPAVDEQSAKNMQRDIEIKDILTLMDEWTKRIWAFRRYGHSWKEIARVHKLEEEQMRLRYTYALDRIRAQVERSKRLRKN
jgi:DNA-directed RNA polymerase specialized sigma24 family protein